MATFKPGAKPFMGVKPPSKITITTIPANTNPMGALPKQSNPKLHTIVPPIKVPGQPKSPAPTVSHPPPTIISAKPPPNHYPVVPAHTALADSPAKAAPPSERNNNPVQESQRAPLADDLGEVKRKGSIAHDTDLSKEPIQSIPEEVGPPVSYSPCLKGFGVTLSLILFFVACGYMAVAGMSAYDKRGKQAYFAEDSTGTEYAFDVAIAYRYYMAQTSGTTLTIKTDNWGYFYTTFRDVMDSSTSRFKDYNAFIPIVVTSGVSGLIAAIAGIVETHKFLKFRPNLAICGLILSLLAFCCCLGGNGYTFYLMYKFNKDFSDTFKLCDCSSFKSDFYRSMTYYFIAVVVFLGLNFLQLIVNIIFCCRRRRYVVVPMGASSDAMVFPVPQPTQS